MNSIKRLLKANSTNKEMTSMSIRFFLQALVLSLLIGLLSSCGTTNRVSKTASKDMTSERLLQQLARQQLSPDWFEAKTRIGYSDDYMSMSASATMIMQKDKLLWMSVKKLGFEVVRVKVTPDSIYVLDRINNEYTIESLDYLSDSYGLPAGLSELQDFILGNPVFLGTDGLSVQPMGAAYRLVGERDSTTAEYLVGAKDYRLHKLAFKDKASEQEASAMLSEYDKIKGNKYFSYLRNLVLESEYSGAAEVELKFTKVEFDTPKQIRFDIPSRYTRAK